MTRHRIIIAGGGTGGHIFPAVAVANAIKILAPAAEILFVGAKGKMEMEKVPQAGYKIEGLDIAGFNRAHWWKNISLPFKLVKSFMEVRAIFKNFKPNAAFGVGGYSSYPVLRYAQSKGIPTFLHESNAFAGKSNMMLGSNATKIFVAANGMEKFFPAEKLVVSGNPVRSEIANMVVSKEEARKFFGLESSKLTLLVVGGSLGAKSINLAVKEGLPALTNSGLQIIWQTGKLFIDEARLATHGMQHVWVNDFIGKMDFAYAAADIVVSRSGAMSVTELCMAKKSVVFVPFPFAAEDHQTANANALVQHDAALLVPDAEAGQNLMRTVLELANDESKRLSLENNIAAMAKYDADKLIAQQILASIHVVD